jgi:hypothetical protein
MKKLAAATPRAPQPSHGSQGATEKANTPAEGPMICPALRAMLRAPW